jgi:hypothetical protein
VVIHTARTAIVVVSVCLLGTSIGHSVMAAEVGRAPSPVWVAATGNAANRDADPSTGYIGCPWLTTGDLKAVWNWMTSQSDRPFSNYLISGSWDARAGTGFCQVGGPPRSTKVVIGIAVVSRDAAKHLKRAAADRGDLYPKVGTEIVPRHPGDEVLEHTVLLASPRLVLTLGWSGTFIKIHEDRFALAMKKVATRMAAHP